MSLYKTFPLAGAVYQNEKTLAANKTHSVLVNDKGELLAVLCGKVRLESVLEDWYLATDEPPTCTHCARKLKALNTPQK